MVLAHIFPPIEQGYTCTISTKAFLSGKAYNRSSPVVILIPKICDLLNPITKKSGSAN